MSLSYSLQRTLKALEEKGKAHYKDIASALGVKPSTARKYLDQLAKMGYAEKLEYGVYRYKGQAAEAKKEEEAPVEEAIEAMKKEAEELQAPGREAVEPLYFHVRGRLVPLRVKTLEQLLAVIRYRLVEPEELNYALKTGYLQAWVSRIARMEELAQKLDEIAGLPAEEQYLSLRDILEKTVS